jgi:hypothetical protein
MCRRPPGGIEVLLDGIDKRRNTALYSEDEVGLLMPMRHPLTCAPGYEPAMRSR